MATAQGSGSLRTTGAHGLKVRTGQVDVDRDKHDGALSETAPRPKGRSAKFRAYRHREVTTAAEPPKEAHRTPFTAAARDRRAPSHRTRTAVTLTIRRRTAITLLIAALLLPFAARPAGAAVDGGAESRFVQLINQARAQAGLPALSVRSDLVAVARRHSARMADADDLHHNPGLAGEVSGWQKLGENVGRGPTVDAIHGAFMDSPGHRANILSADFTEVGVGVEVRDGGRIWVTEVFRLPLAAEPAPEPAPEPEPVPQPAPAPAPAEQTAAPAAPAAPAQQSAPQPDGSVTAAAAEPAASLHEVDDRTALMLAQMSARDLGVSVSETLSDR